MAGIPTDEHPIRLVESIVAGGFFGQARRDAAQAEIGQAFATVFHDGTHVRVQGELVSPAMLLRVCSIINEVPEGNWGIAGRTVGALEISSFIGNPPGRPARARADGGRARQRLARTG